jgi:hypothetical protein
MNCSNCESDGIATYMAPVGDSDEAYLCDECMEACVVVAPDGADMDAVRAAVAEMHAVAGYDVWVAPDGAILADPDMPVSLITM